MRKGIRLLLLGNLPIVRAGLRALIEGHDDLTVIAEAPAQGKALELNGHERPDIVLLDCDPDAANATDLLSELSKGEAPIPIILLTNSQDRDFQQCAIKLGARGQVSKTQTPEILFKAIQKVYAGEVWFERVIMAHALGEMSRKNGANETSVEEARIGTLSKREREVVVLIGEGLKNKQIADRLFLSETTVQHHLSSIFGKLGVADRLELVIYAYRQGLVKLPSDFKKKG
jgi:DNA-binding NarL/FixJ family response regulator